LPRQTTGEAPGGVPDGVEAPSICRGSRRRRDAANAVEALWASDSADRRRPQRLYPDLASAERHVVAGGVVEAGVPGGAWFLGGALDGDAVQVGGGLHAGRLTDAEGPALTLSLGRRLDPDR